MSGFAWRINTYDGSDTAYDRVKNSASATQWPTLGSQARHSDKTTHALAELFFAPRNPTQTVIRLQGRPQGYHSNPLQRGGTFLPTHPDSAPVSSLHLRLHYTYQATSAITKAGSLPPKGSCVTSSSHNYRSSCPFCLTKRHLSSSTRW